MKLVLETGLIWNSGIKLHIAQSNLLQHITSIHPKSPSAKAPSNGSSCRGNFKISFPGGCSGPAELPWILHSCRLLSECRVGEEQLLAGFSYSNSAQEPLSRIWLCHSGPIWAADLCCIKGRLMALEGAVSRTGNIRAWHFQLSPALLGHTEQFPVISVCLVCHLLLQKGSLFSPCQSMK